MKYWTAQLGFFQLLLILGYALVAGAATEDDNWDARFTPPGVNSTVAAVAVSGDDVYVGGTFTAAGSISATNIARWNRHTGWSALEIGRAHV